MKREFSIVFFLITISVSAQKQQNSADANAEIEKCKKEAAEANERARLAEEKAMQFQKMAEQNAARAERAEKSAERGRHIAQGKLMAIKSLELGSDPEQEALVALLAYKFNKKYYGNPLDNDIYNGLYAALSKFKDPILKEFEGQVKVTAENMEKMSNSLCNHLNRNMTKEEWTNFAGSDLPYEMVCDNLNDNNR